MSIVDKMVTGKIIWSDEKVLEVCKRVCERVLEVLEVCKRVTSYMITIDHVPLQILQVIMS